MSHLPPNGQPRPGGPIQRARGTAPLDGYVPSHPSAGGTGQLDQVLRREDLQRELERGDKLVTAMRPRVTALDRAIASLDATGEALETVFVGVTPSERAFTMRLAQEVAATPERLRQARILVTQFKLAEQALAEAKAADRQFAAAELAVGRVEGFSLTKFKGALYPLYYFSTQFPGLPMLGSLFPRLKQPAQTQPLSPTQPLPSPPAAAQPSASPPSLAAPAEKLGKLVGDLWRKTGFLKKD